MITDNVRAYYSRFGEPATFTHGVLVKTVSVIYDRAGGLTMVGEIEVRNATPTARCITADIAVAVQNDTLMIGGVKYYIADQEPINTKEMLLHLSVTPV